MTQGVAPGLPLSKREGLVLLPRKPRVGSQPVDVHTFGRGCAQDRLCRAVGASKRWPGRRRAWQCSLEQCRWRACRQERNRNVTSARPRSGCRRTWAEKRVRQNLVAYRASVAGSVKVPIPGGIACPSKGWRCCECLGRKAFQRLKAPTIIKADTKPDSKRS